MNLSHGFPGVAIHFTGCSPRFFLELVVTFIGRRLVTQSIRFFVVDSLFFHGAGSGEDGAVVVGMRMRMRELVTRPCSRRNRFAVVGMSRSMTFVLDLDYIAFWQIGVGM